MIFTADPARVAVGVKLLKPPTIIEFSGVRFVTFRDAGDLHMSHAVSITLICLPDIGVHDLGVVEVHLHGYIGLADRLDDRMSVGLAVEKKARCSNNSLVVGLPESRLPSPSSLDISSGSSVPRPVLVGVISQPSASRALMLPEAPGTTPS